MGERGAHRVPERAVAALADAAIALLLAPRCAACLAPLDAPLSGAVCATCWSSIAPLSAPLCRTCGVPLPSWRSASLAVEMCVRCRRHPPLVECARAAGAYDGTLRAVIHAYKYEGRRSLAVPLGALMRVRTADVLQDAACVVPVPLHPWRRLRRGFNQATDLAATLGPPLVRALWRARATAQQTGLSARDRRSNVHGAIVLSPLLTRRYHDALRGQVVVLVDDVHTTGATLDACAAVLKAAGAKEVRAVTAAVARAIDR